MHYERNVDDRNIIFDHYLCYAQEKFTIPELTLEQKHNRSLFQLYSMMKVGIKFANSQGVAPYEYGKYCGSQFAKSWNQENGYEGFIRGMIYNWESFRSVQDDPLVPEEMDDGSVEIKLPLDMMKRYYREDDLYASFEEGLEAFRGMIEPIADRMGSVCKLEVIEEFIVYTISKKSVP